MTTRNFSLLELLIIIIMLLRYVSSGNAGYLVICLGIIGILISTTGLINFNRIIYYAALLCIIIVQSMTLINTYLFNMTYLQNIEQYSVLGFGVVTYAILIALLFKPNIFKE